MQFLTILKFSMRYMNNLNHQNMLKTQIKYLDSTIEVKDKIEELFGTLIVLFYTI